MTMRTQSLHTSRPRTHLLALLFTPLLLISGHGAEKEQPFDARPQPWQRRAEPILSALTTKEDWCKVVLYSPAVIFHDGKFRMWYLGTSTQTRKANTNMGYAESDDGINWKPHSSNPILTGDDIPWGVFLQTPNVLFDAEESLYKMWFVSGPIREIGKNGYVYVDQQLGYATSRDGINWNIRPKPIFPSGRSPSVIKQSDGTYRMWMGARPDTTGTSDDLFSNIFEFHSADGIKWQQMTKPSILPGGKIKTAIYPFVVKEKNNWYMWYGGHVDGGKFELFCARSKDGSTWETDQENAAFPAREGKTAFDSRYTSTPCIVTMPDRYLLYYSARDWIKNYVDGAGVKHRDNSSPYAHIGVAVIPR